MRFIKWGNIEYDVQCDSIEPVRMIENILTDLVYTKKYYSFENKYIVLDKEPPFNKENYYLKYNIKLKDNEADNNNFLFAMYLIEDLVDTINYLEENYKEDD